MSINKIILSISKLNLSSNIEKKLKSNKILFLTDLNGLSENDLKSMPGIGYATARKVISVYEAYIKNIMKTHNNNNSHIPNPIEKAPNSESIIIHPLLEKSNLNKQDKEIISLIIQGYSQQQVSSQFNLSQRTLRHHLAMLKIEYQAKTVTQLVCNIFDEVLL